MTTTPDPQQTHPTTTAVVSGANKGIGLETARQLLALGWTVWLGSRDPDRGRTAAAALAAEGHPGTVHALDLDVTDDASVAAAVEVLAEVLAGTGVDVLVNNAGVAGEDPAPDETEPRHFLPVFGANVLGPVRLTHALLPLLRASADARVVNVSSGLGSFARMADTSQPGSDYADLVYPSSKAALNMITVQYAKALPGIRVNAVAPGYTATDLNDHRGTQRVEDAAAVVVSVATAGPEVVTGTFLDADGVRPW